MIVVTGAGGRLGGAVLAALLESVPASEVGISTTAPEQAAALAERGVRVRRGDYDDPASLLDAFEGADRLLVVSAPRIGPSALEAHRTVVEAAHGAGVGHVFYTSHIGADALSPFPPAVTHAATEVLLRDSGIAFTALRNGFYADTPLRLAATAVAAGELRAPADAPVSWTVHEDLAPAIAAVLLDPVLPGHVVDLTAGEALDMARIAETVSSLTGRRIPRIEVPDDEYRAGLIANGLPEVAADMTLGIFLASRQRRLGITDPAMEGLLGRPTARLEHLLAERLAAAPA